MYAWPLLSHYLTSRCSSVPPGQTHTDSIPINSRLLRVVWWVMQTPVLGWRLYWIQQGGGKNTQKKIELDSSQVLSQAVQWKVAVCWKLESPEDRMPKPPGDWLCYRCYVFLVIWLWQVVGGASNTVGQQPSVRGDELPAETLAASTSICASRSSLSTCAPYSTTPAWAFRFLCLLFAFLQTFIAPFFTLFYFIYLFLLMVRCLTFGWFDTSALDVFCLLLYLLL